MGDRSDLGNGYPVWPDSESAYLYLFLHSAVSLRPVDESEGRRALQFLTLFLLSWRLNFAT